MASDETASAVREANNVPPVTDRYEGNAMPTKARPTVGDTAWFAEWCHEMAFDENGDADFDRHKMTRRRFATGQEAIAYAKSVADKAAKTLGAVEVWQSEFVPYDDDDRDSMPHAGFWEVCSEPQWIEQE